MRSYHVSCEPRAQGFFLSLDYSAASACATGSHLFTGVSLPAGVWHANKKI